ncbi:MAG: MBL fold metallo-hydrolase [Gammaproteobacteria bacterium]|nr:MBL fold metallo-hydrolase [Gammaproteobacteria bacterium]
MRLTILGAARQVTGSSFLFANGPHRFLVDCGMFQGPRGAVAQNHRPFAFDPAALDFVLLTHAHIDHSGLLPRLVAAGFAGPVYLTAATRDLLGVLLPDSAWLQQMEAARSHGRRGARPALYTVAEAERVLQHCRPVDYDLPFEPAAGIRCRFRDAGHILGSAIIELTLTEQGLARSVVVSGDLGQPGRPILRDPVAIDQADVLLVESTYGDRDHRSQAATIDEFVATVGATLHGRGGNLIVPAFAVGRTQELLYWFNVLAREGRIEPPRIYVDSPMATEVTQITARHLALFDQEARRLAAAAPVPGREPRVRFVGSVAESMALNRVQGGIVIIAASGMCEGGRIRHHLRHHLPNPRSTVMITGFQAQGTLGRALVDGVQWVRIHGHELRVRARIVTLGGFSAHADQHALLDWLGHFRRPPARTLLVHGEERAQLAFHERIRQRHGWDCTIPAQGEVIDLGRL